MKCATGEVSVVAHYDRLWKRRYGRLAATQFFTGNDDPHVELTPSQMRRLAGMLTRAADRIEKRGKK